MADISPDILFTPLTELSVAIRDGKLSPVALAEVALDRLEKLGPKFGAVVTVMRESALKEAAEREKEIKQGTVRGTLHGIPYGVKDLLATKGVPTTWGAAPYRKQVFDYDATVVEKLRQAGAVLCAKLAMVELAGGMGYRTADASFTGPGKTPWNDEYWSGGSSTGPGAAVAAGMVSFAIGSETSGSIITPAAYCGVTGLRPTYGRVSRHGAMALCWTLDKLGPMGRSAEDCAAVLKAIAGKDPRDNTSVGRPFVYPEKPRKFRIGIVKGTFTGVQPAVKKNIEASIKVLKEFAEVETKEVPLPDMPFGSAVGTIVNAEGASAFRDLIESGRIAELQDENDKINGYAMLMVPAVDYLAAMRVRVKMKKAMAEMFTSFDALLAPARESVAPPIGKDKGLWYPNTSSPATGIIGAGNLAGQPAISIPNGFGDNNLPTGFQLAGAIWCESVLVAIAAEYQKRTDFHRKFPKLG